MKYITMALQAALVAYAFWPQPKNRVGATCQDGSRTGATGHGTCSHHGGVKRWRYR